MVSVISQGHSSNLKPIKYKVTRNNVNSKLVIYSASKYFYAATLMNNSYMLCLSYLMPIHMAALIVVVRRYSTLKIRYFRDRSFI